MDKKILLDRSIFHGNKFTLLKQSRLKELTRRHIITIYGNHILFEETLNLWFLNRKEELKEHAQYILDITNGRWFRSREEIWKIELEGINLSDKYFFLTNTEQRCLINQIYKQIIAGKLDKDLEEEVKKEKEQNFIKNKNIKLSCFKMREEVSGSLSQLGKKRTDVKESFEYFYNKNVDWCGEEIIKSHLETKTDKGNLINKWKQNKYRYPYFTLWVKAFLYIPFYAMSKPNEKIDINAIMDIGQLVCLKDLDIIVSDEKKFMKDSFEQLYGNNKQFFSLKDFLCFANNH